MQGTDGELGRGPALPTAVNHGQRLEILKIRIKDKFSWDGAGEADSTIFSLAKFPIIC